MKKKYVSLVLVALMLITALTGCGPNDLGYLNLSGEISKLTQYNFINNTQIEISKELADEDFNIDLNIEGEINIDDVESAYMNLDVLMKINDIEIEKPINLVLTDNKLLVSKNALLEFVAIEQLKATEVDKKIVEQLYYNDLKDVEYIILVDLTETYPNTMYLGEKNEKLYDDAIDYLTKAFEGFDSNLISKTSKGFVVEMNSKNTLAFIENLINYIKDNKELVFDETINYLEKYYSNIEIDDLSDTDKEIMFEELKSSRQDFYDAIDEAAMFLNSGELDIYIDMLEDSVIKEEIYKEKDSYKDITEVKIVYDGIEMININSNTSIVPTKIEKVSLEGKTIEVVELENLYNKTENYINPVQKMQLEWYEDSYFVQVESARLEGNIDNDYKDFANIDNSIYLPLRFISESFGEEVDWDNENKKAYIIRDEEKIEMTGVIIDSNTMVKVRDFEKLGYKVDYIQEDGKSIATITKN
ncbi:copper amine oxidase N-terminal domain-containing protein [Sedimentibacter sp. MB31-C6]|uniref:copper amine oxidase N-terminal domain-containing protein n=1 Tax=Sedimentibacter sp. MB31-C6 TaxID=3109366 RepID=UPI002DDCC221|nr:copper amine oxidase N-terminal domain-containing protein [Sedimentibacter sp. MB36-C1]WSI04002.1 copper amine oxidase N-terminal domain-containing protein [Sedimentibacter sp. MB36-C1]